MKLSLYFEQSHGRVALEEAHFCSGDKEEGLRVARRGALFTYNTMPFRWVPSVCALSIAFVRVKLLHSKAALYEALLSGGPGTPARTLCRSVYRSDQKFLDLFGVTRAGRPKIFNILHFSHPSNAPARTLYSVRLFKGGLEPESISIFLSGTQILLPALLELELSLYKEFEILLSTKGRPANEDILFKPSLP